MENSSEPWRDVSECEEHHYFKDKVRERVCFPLGFNAKSEVSILQFVSFSRGKSSRKTIRDYFLDCP